MSMGTGLLAQSSCSNISNPSRNNTRSNHIFEGKSFGQSILADPYCLGGSKFSSFSFWAQGSSPIKFDLAIYEGENLRAVDRRYIQEDIRMPPSNRGKKLRVNLTAAYGDLSFNRGSTYTFLITIAKSGGGNLIAHTSYHAVEGKAYLQDQFVAGSDLIFEIGVSTSSIIIESADYGNFQLNKSLSSSDEEKLKNILQNMVDAGTTSFRVSDELLLNKHGMKNPIANKPKTLIVTYSKGGKLVRDKKVIEKKTFCF